MRPPNAAEQAPTYSILSLRNTYDSYNLAIPDSHLKEFGSPGFSANFLTANPVLDTTSDTNSLCTTLMDPLANIFVLGAPVLSVFE